MTNTERALTRVGVPEHTARLIAATATLRVSSVLAAAVALGFSLLAARAGPRGVVMFLALAPMLPLAGVAATFGPGVDPTYEIARAAPTRAFRLLLVRGTAVLAVTLVVSGVAALTLPQLDWTASAWLLPSLALTVASLALATFVPPIQAAVAVAWLWVTCLIVTTTFSHSALTAFRGPAQAVFFAVIVMAAVVVGWRRERFDTDRRRRGREVVEARDAERRRLERDLHDGAQQHLVAVAVKLRLARSFVARDPARAEQMLAGLEHDVDEALQALRELARGSHPPVLTDRGVVAALEASAARSPVPVSIQAHGVQRYPAEVESAVYFCCLEASQDAAKHAQASAIQIRLEDAAGELTFWVKDDGRGFDPKRAASGSGLAHLGERLVALGGRLDVRSRPGHGTTVIGMVPWAAAVGSPPEEPESLRAATERV